MGIRILGEPVTDLPVEAWASEAGECLMALHCATQPDGGRGQFLEIGEEWFNEIGTAASPRLGELLDACRPPDGVQTACWFQLLGLAADAALDVPALLGRLHATPADELWCLILGGRESPHPDPALLEAIADAGRGQVAALRRRLAPLGRAKRAGRLEAVRLFGDPAGAKAVLTETLERWHEEFFGVRWPALRPPLEREAERARRLGAELGTADLIEQVTNGMEHVAEAAVDRLLLLPTRVGAPWVYRGRHLGTVIYVYPVGEDALASGPDEARRVRLLRVARALSDETRLRTLQRLATDASTLQELADHLGVRKSLMHHHLAVLRSAGLLRVSMGLRYSVRPSAVADLSPLLGAYLGLAPSRKRRRR